MAERVIFVEVKMTINNDEVDEITDEMIDDIICDVDYNFNVNDFQVETEIVDTMID